MTKYAYELIGTFFLVLTIGLVVVPGAAGALAPVAIGGVLAALVFMGGHASGAHYNPGVTLAIWLRGRLPAADILPYIGAQLIGAVLASLAVVYLAGPGTPMVIESVPRALLGEALFTFALVFVVLNVATAKGTVGNSFYGIAIGLTVLAGAYAVGGLSGGAFNTAVAAGLAIMKLVPAEDIWIHVAANLGAGAAAGLAFKALQPQDK